MENIDVLLKFSEISYILNTLFILFSACLVMWMAAGFCMLESGLVRSKNTIEILMKNICLYALSCLCYFFIGYAIMYGESGNLWLPSFGFGIDEENAIASLAGESAPEFSNSINFFFQMVFVATSMSIISGAVAERMKLISFLLFTLFMTTLIYPVVGYWVWGGGILSDLGFSDFAGSGVVHYTGALAALVGVKLLGARKGKFGSDGKPMAIMGANLPLAALGTLILWLGWFGFNAGSQFLIASFDDANIVSKILVNTNMAAAAGLVGAMITSKFKYKKFDLTMTLNGVLAGLVGITAAPQSPSTMLAIGIGFFCGVIVVYSILFLDKLKIDDPVGAISVHGVIGIVGVLAVPLSNPDSSFLVQLTGLLLITVWVAIASAICWKIIDLITSLRTSEEEEMNGSDLSEFGMEAYPEFTKSS